MKRIMKNTLRNVSANIVAVFSCGKRKLIEYFELFASHNCAVTYSGALTNFLSPI